MVVYFGNLTKRHNSTKRPSTGSMHSLTCRLLGNSCSKAAPSLEVSHDVSGYTYAYIPKFDRYYYISSIASVPGGLWVVTLATDLMATFKTDILSRSEMIDRSASAYDNMMEDSAISQSYEAPYISRAVTEISEFSTAGCFILRTSGRSTSVGANIGVNTYAITPSEIRGALDWMFNDGNFGDWATDTIAKSMFKPFEHIISLTWVPFSVSTLSSGGAQPIIIGMYVTDSVAHPVTVSQIVADVTVSIPDSNYSDFRAYSAKWNRIKAKLPCIGEVELNPTEVGASFGVRYYIDVATFNCSAQLYVKRGDYRPRIGYFQGNAGVNIQMSQQSVSPNALSNAAFSVAGAGLRIAGGSIPTLGQVSDIVNLFNPTMQVSGVAGNITELRNNNLIEVTRVEYRSKGISVATMGRPLREVRQLSSLSGYCKTINADIPLDALASERESVNAMLNGGFYIE